MDTLRENIDNSIFFSNSTSSIEVWNSDIIQLKSLDIKFFTDRNITDDVKMIRYLMNNAYKENNIFTSVKKMKENYIINFLYYHIFNTSTDNIRILNENTYIINKGNIAEVNILDNNMMYSLEFTNTYYFNQQYIEELVLV